MNLTNLLDKQSRFRWSDAAVTSLKWQYVYFHTTRLQTLPSCNTIHTPCEFTSETFHLVQFSATWPSQAYYNTWHHAFVLTGEVFVHNNPRHAAATSLEISVLITTRMFLVNCDHIICLYRLLLGGTRVFARSYIAIWKETCPVWFFYITPELFSMWLTTVQYDFLSTYFSYWWILWATPKPFQNAIKLQSNIKQNTK